MTERESMKPPQRDYQLHAKVEVGLAVMGMIAFHADPSHSVLWVVLSTVSIIFAVLSMLKGTSS